MKRVYADVKHYYYNGEQARGFEDLGMLMETIFTQGWSFVDGTIGKEWRYANDEQVVVINGSGAITLYETDDSPVWYDVLSNNGTRAEQFNTFDCASALARHMSAFYNEHAYVVCDGEENCPDVGRIWEYHNGELVSRETMEGGDY